MRSREVRRSFTLANFARAQKLNLRFIFVTRHPLTVIRATQEWIADKQSHGKHKQWDTSVAEIAKMWRKAARLATEAASGRWPNVSLFEVNDACDSGDALAKALGIDRAQKAPV